MPIIFIILILFVGCNIVFCDTKTAKEVNTDEANELSYAYWEAVRLNGCGLQTARAQRAAEAWEKVGNTKNSALYREYQQKAIKECEDWYQKENGGASQN